MEILQVKNLNFAYPGGEGVLSDINLTVNAGEMLLLCGVSGCGKTTLLRLMKPELAPAGELSGSIEYADGAGAPCDVGYVMQNPDSQLVTDKVWHELAFGLENLGLPTEVIRRRVGEMASYFGITDWFRKRTDELSGGQKQILNLAAIMVMQPKLLILDEPTSQLDPIAAADFIATVARLNRELGLTVIIAEHRLEEIFPVADRVVLMDKGKILLCDVPGKVGDALPEGHAMQAALPSPVRLHRLLSLGGRCPLTVRDGRIMLEEHYDVRGGELPEAEPPAGECAIELRGAWFRYERDLPDVLRGTTLFVRRGEILSVLGDNGSGKTTMLKVISGLCRAYRGRVMIKGKPIKEYKGNTLYRGVLSLLPQNPETLFVRDNVHSDLRELLEAHGTPASERDERIDELAARLGITHLIDRNPFDLSGGEIQKCALAKVLLTSPEILLLDEPTKGIDAMAKEELCSLIRSLSRDGVTVLIVTHDVEFAAGVSERCALFFDGEILSADTPGKFFGGNTFYTTAANRMARALCRNAVTCRQVCDFLGGGRV